MFPGSDRYKNPEQFISELVRGAASGQIFGGRDRPVLLRATVAAVDVLGGQLENPLGVGGVTHILPPQTITIPASMGPVNPPGSIKARIISDGWDQFLDSTDLRVFWPFFPEHQSVPVKPREHVYVMFEDDDMQHGLWICKVAGQTGVNYSQGQSFFSTNSPRLASAFGAAPPALQPTDREAGERQVVGLPSAFGL